VWQYNYIAAIIKRVSSTTWLELRYGSANHTAMNAAHPSPSAPYSLELWSSHNTAGTLGATKLDAWDVPTSTITSGAIKFVRAYMIAGNQVIMELWDGVDPNPGDIGLASRRTYTLNSSLTALMGIGVAGSTGFATKLAQWGNGTIGITLETIDINYEWPYVASFDSIDYAASQIWMSCPVIGGGDEIPWQLQLRGDIDSPTILLISYGNEEIRTATMRLSGVFTEADPVTIDSDTGRIRSESGGNYFPRRQPGSRFQSLTAGQNFVLIQAAGWDTTASVHAIATWRDALL
jgi:hypothetical protein